MVRAGGVSRRCLGDLHVFQLAGEIGVRQEEGLGTWKKGGKATGVGFKLPEKDTGRPLLP